MIVPLRILGPRVLVKPDVLDNAPVQTESGVVIALSMAAAVTGSDPTQSVCRGTVLAVGQPKHPRYAEAHSLAGEVGMYGVDEDMQRAAELLRDLVRREPCCAIGDDVLYSHDAGQAIAIENESYVLLNETELLAIVEPEKEAVHG